MRVAVRVPTTQGMPSSRETMAAWDVMPPASVTIAAARRMSGTQSGEVIAATSTSPGSSLDDSPTVESTRTRPVAVPGLAPSPRSSGSRPGSGAFEEAGEGAEDVSADAATVLTLGSVVIGRVWVMKICPPAMANSMSCGAA